MPPNDTKNEKPRHWPSDSPSTFEERLLSGRRSTPAELRAALKILTEFLHGLRAFRRIPPCVTVFGSARFAPGHQYYELARSVGREIAKAGYGVMTGGGPGVMEAANRGAREAGGVSLGCNIRLPREQQPNAYLDRFVEFDHFFVRKVMLVKYSRAFVLLPGGFGTMDEIFETLTLIQTRKMKSFPVITLGGEFWDHLRPFLRSTMLEHGTIDPADLDLVTMTDSAEEAVAAIRGAT